MYQAIVQNSGTELVLAFSGIHLSGIRYQYIVGFFEPAFYNWLDRWAELTASLVVLSWAELAQGVSSQINPAWAGSTQLRDWASLSWKDLELRNWARLTWTCFSLSQHELGRHFMNFSEKMWFIDQKWDFFPFFLASSSSQPELAQFGSS